LRARKRSVSLWAGLPYRGSPLRDPVVFRGFQLDSKVPAREWREYSIQ